MLTFYYSNLLETQKDILLHLIQTKPLDPFQQETILVQSPGMAQWLNWQIAEKMGIASNIIYPMPASFIWQLYVDNLPNVETQSDFKKAHLIWRIMAMLPNFLEKDAFSPLCHYLEKTEKQQLKLYQLAYQIADLFDQYLVYRPEWIHFWQEKQEEKILSALINEKNQPMNEQIRQSVAWQGELWRALVAEISQQTVNQTLQHRANLHLQFLTFLSQNKPVNLPERLFIFGISALPKTYLDTLKALSPYCDIHLFFTNGCQEYWGDVIDPKHWQRLQLQQRLLYQQHQQKSWLSADKVPEFQTTGFEEQLPTGHPLLATWGKMGRDFLYLLTETANQIDGNVQEIAAYVESEGENLSLLQQVQKKILNFEPSKKNSLELKEQDHSLTIHSCYSPMREVEVLQDYVLHLLQQDPTLTPKDIVVMVADIDKYTPYIQAVFGQHHPYIPFAIADNKLTETDILVGSFLQLLNLKESPFNAEAILALLDIPPIRERFAIELNDLSTLHRWVEKSGVRFGLVKEEKIGQIAHKNYNAWLAGLNRLLLGFSLREENGIWQDNLGFDQTAGLQSELAGKLADFIHSLWDWHQFLQAPHLIEEWQDRLKAMITQFFDADQQNPIWQHLWKNIEALTQEVKKGSFTQGIDSEVIVQNLQERLEDTPNRYRFTLGKMNFCTLLPMRSIPFKVVCLLGMNDGEFPRIQVPNSFDLMQYHHQKGDRFRRDDDRYLFLEALLSAQQAFYVSFIGRSIKDDSELEPSILVSQLRDYLEQNLKESRIQWQFQHALNAFSALNFMGETPSFAKQWLRFAEHPSVVPLKDFNQPLPQVESSSQLTLEALLKFVENPVEDFFERCLGLYYRQQADQIPEMENFSLTHLQNYLLFEDLIDRPLNDFATQWQKWQVKGALPHHSFAELAKETTFETLQHFKARLADFLPQNEEAHTITLTLELAGLHLSADFRRYYPKAERLLSYRPADIKGKDFIQSYLNALVWAAKGISITVIHLGRDNTLQIPPIPTETATKQLQLFLQAYQQGNQQLFLLPNKHLEKFIVLKAQKVQSTTVVNGVIKEKDLIQEVDYLTDGKKQLSGEWMPANPYWQRLKMQQDIDITSMFETLNQWFAHLAVVAELS